MYSEIITDTREASEKLSVLDVVTTFLSYFVQVSVCNILELSQNLFLL